MTKIAEKAQEFTTIEDVKKAQKRVASVKCRLKKQKAKKTYEVEMAAILAEEQLLKEVKDYMEPKKQVVTKMSQADINDLNYDETIRAIKSIQSKKCLVQYITEDPKDNVELQEAIAIENMLKAHRETIKPIEDTVVKKSDINDLIESLSNGDTEISKEYILEQLMKLKA